VVGGVACRRRYADDADAAALTTRAACRKTHSCRGGNMPTATDSAMAVSTIDSTTLYPAASAASVAAVQSSRGHTFSKPASLSLTLLQGLGVDGDAHCGVTARHRSRVARDTGQPNLRQVHLIHEELLAELAQKGFRVLPGQIGENVTTRGLRLLDLPAGTCLCLGETAVVQLTGLRNPCVQLDRFRPGLMAAVLDRADDGGLIRKAGVMGIVASGGVVYPGDRIDVRLPDRPHRPLQPV
jgi:MOSC domain-containing protein YiiM